MEISSENPTNKLQPKYFKHWWGWTGNDQKTETDKTKREFGFALQKFCSSLSLISGLFVVSHGQANYNKQFEPNGSFPSSAWPSIPELFL